MLLFCFNFSSFMPVPEPVLSELHPKYWTTTTDSSSAKGFTSMNGWRQTARAQFDSSVVVVFKIGDQFCFKLLYGCKLLQIKQLRFEEPKEIFHDSIIQAIPLSAHALPNVLAFQHVPILSMLVMPALVRVKNQICPIRNFMKRFLQHGGHHL